MTTAQLAVGFPNPPIATPFTQNGAITNAWVTWFRSVTAILGTANSTLLLFPAPYTTASGTPVSTGFGIGAIKSQVTNAFLISGGLLLSNNTLGSAVYIRLWRSIKGIPAAGAAPASGDVQLAALGGPEALANGVIGLSLYYSDKNLVAQPYYYYLTLDTGGTGGAAKVNGDGVNHVTGFLNLDEYF